MRYALRAGRADACSGRGRHPGDIQPDGKRQIVTYRIQIFHPESGFYINTNHISDDLAALRKLADSKLFWGVRIRIADEANEMIYEPELVEKGELSVEDLASILDVPIGSWEVLNELQDFDHGDDPDDFR